MKAVQNIFVENMLQNIKYSKNIFFKNICIEKRLEGHTGMLTMFDYG